MGVKDILLLMKCVKILDLTTTSLSNPIPTSFLHDESPFGTLIPPCSPASFFNVHDTFAKATS
jgi:hypothetical protein